MSIENLEKYLVGGAVRDLLLGIEPKDKDYVVVNSNEEEMINLGFTKVGADFPIFLHSETGEEYALARTERKSSTLKSNNPYHNFDIETENVSLEDDLMRRDLTINSMAMDKDGNVIDYFGGVNDLKNKFLKHTSIAFMEDPIRILRVARFAARYYDNGFQVHDSTMNLMIQMINDGMLENLTKERVMTEFRKGLMENNADVMIDILYRTGALRVLLPEVHNLFGVPQNPTHHPEIDTGIHTMMVLNQACKLNLTFDERYACLLHDLGKGITPKEDLPSHPMHDIKGIPLVENVNERFKASKSESKTAVLVCKAHQLIHTSKKLNPKTILRLFDECGAYSNDKYLISLLNCAKADSMGRKGFQNVPYPQYEYMLDIFNFVKEIDVKDVANRTVEKAKMKNNANTDLGKNIKENIFNYRLKILKNFLDTMKVDNVNLEENSIDLKKVINKNNGLKI